MYKIKTVIVQENFNILHFCWDTVLFFKSRETDYLLLKYKNIFFLQGASL